MKIKLLINITPIRKPLTGIGYYTLNILRVLLTKDIDVIGIKNGKIITRDQLILLSQEFLQEEQNLNTANNQIKRRIIEFIRMLPGIYKIKNILLTFRVKQALLEFAENNYVYFEPSFIPFEYNGKTITTIHDLSFISFPEFHPKTRVDYLKSKISDAIKISTHVIVDSNYILDEMHGYFPFSLKKSSTVYLGVDRSFQPYSELECKEINQKLNLKYKKFILSVATLEPRKNLQHLIAAYLMLPAKVRDKHPLVLVGDQGWKNTELFSEANQLIKTNQLIFTGYVSDYDLKRLYASSMIFAYPSLYEGFGLPVAEAMASGIPVITSSRGATMEIADNAAFLVDPMSKQAISDALLKLIDNSTLREKLSSDGLKQAQRYSWESTVEQLLEIAKTI